MIVVLEGLDGSGKSTQAQLLKEALEALEVPTQLVKFPDYSTPTGRILKDWLHGDINLMRHTRSQYENSQVDKGDSLALQMLYLANRLEQAKRIREFPGVTIIDRYWPSSVAYGCGIDGLDYAHVLQLSAELPRGDLHILVEPPLTVCLARQQNRGRVDRYEQSMDRMIKAHTAYRQLWEHMLASHLDGKGVGSWIRIAGDLTVEKLHQAILRQVQAWRFREP